MIIQMPGTWPGPARAINQACKCDILPFDPTVLRVRGLQAMQHLHMCKGLQ